MAKALEYPAVFKALLRGGHICRTEPVMGTTRYTVAISSPYKIPEHIGHITERQFGELGRNSIIKPLPGIRTAKDGSVLTYWVLEEAGEDE